MESRLSTAAQGAVVSCGGTSVPDVGDACSKLYRPLGSPFFACRQCHDLTYLCVQKHDARLDRLVNAPDWLIWHCIRHGEGPWPLLACRAAYVKLAVTGKY